MKAAFWVTRDLARKGERVLVHAREVPEPPRFLRESACAGRVGRALLGSVATAVIREGSRPILVVRASDG